MLKRILNFFKFYKKYSLVEINILSLPRDKGWRKLRNEHLKEHPECIVCGSVNNVVPHHVIPVHEDRTKEMDKNNLVTLCENKTFNCHFFFGHLKNWCKSNKNIREDAEYFKKRLNSNINSAKNTDVSLKSE